MPVEAVALAAVWFVLTLLVGWLRLARPELISGSVAVILFGWFLFTGFLVFLVYSDRRRRRLRARGGQGS